MLTNILLYLLKKTGWVEPYIEISNCIIIHPEFEPPIKRNDGNIRMENIIFKDISDKEYSDMYSKELDSLKHISLLFQ